MPDAHMRRRWNEPMWKHDVTKRSAKKSPFEHDHLLHAHGWSKKKYVRLESIVLYRNAAGTLWTTTCYGVSVCHMYVRAVRCLYTRPEKAVVRLVTRSTNVCVCHGVPRACEVTGVCGLYKSDVWVRAGCRVRVLNVVESARPLTTRY